MGGTGRTYVWTAVILYAPHWKWRGHNKRTMKTDNIRKLVWTNYVTNVYKNQDCPGSVTFVFSSCAKEKLHSAHFFDSLLWNQKHNIFLGLIRNILCHALLLWHHTGHLGFTVMLIWCFTPLSTLFKSYCDIMKGSIQWSTMIHRHEQNSSSRNLESSDLKLGELTTLPPGCFEV